MLNPLRKATQCTVFMGAAFFVGHPRVVGLKGLICRSFVIYFSHTIHASCVLAERRQAARFPGPSPHNMDREKGREGRGGEGREGGGGG